ncbi:uncharacterized protein BXZ73DRAFT_48276 [Epithele typhae]|uniref:uncharacterized protein n=1 Tax=Epithele typhae TaxID=378194 RepID=UPI0020088DC3|nr:uncharacterized protein BXZ73DRAFT_48276 [Epithele typhae]KAH9929040.1 hypothetical protein BXZ73DRAFT_48276 [Epithele typhae]
MENRTKGDNDDTITEVSRRSNQHKPMPPDHILKTLITKYYNLGFNDKKIHDYLVKEIDVEKYGVPGYTIARRRKEWELLSVRKQGHTMESIHENVQALKQRFPGMGAQSLKDSLRVWEGLQVPRTLLRDYLKTTEPEAVAARRYRGKFKRYRFWCVGVNDFWSFDQHDKWGPRFGLWLHVCIEPMSGKILWLKIWWTNSNPRLIASYYLEAARALKGVPLVTQSDPGSENYGIAHAHTFIRHRLDPSLEGTLQHRWMRNKMNIKPEIAWSQLRSNWAPGFEALLQSGVDQGLYDPSDSLQSLVFRWLVIPWLQRELDLYRFRTNSTQRRAKKTKVLPRGIPDLIFENPTMFSTCDFKVGVPAELFDEAERNWAPRDHVVFQLVPPGFQLHVSRIYSALGEPDVSYQTFWVVYRDILTGFYTLADHTAHEYQMLLQDISESTQAEKEAAEERLQKPEGLHPVAQGAPVIGQLPHGVRQIPLAELQGDISGDTGIEDGGAVGMEHDDEHYFVFSSDEEELDENDPGMF